jgi:hypothetical protein
MRALDGAAHRFLDRGVGRSGKFNEFVNVVIHGRFVSRFWFAARLAFGIRSRRAPGSAACREDGYRNEPSALADGRPWGLTLRVPPGSAGRARGLPASMGFYLPFSPAGTQFAPSA